MENWRTAKLTDIAEYINGYAFKPSDFSESGVPIVRIEQLKNPNGNFDYYDGKIPERNWINDGDLVFSWSASLFLRIWQYGFAYLNQHLFKVLPKDGVDKYFLKYLLEAAVDELVKKSHGSTMQHITRKELQQFVINLPSLTSEQITIATILTTIDQAIEKTEQLIAKYERIKTGLMQDLLTRGIDEQGNIRSEETHEFKDSELGRIPVEWETKFLNEVCDYQNGKSFPSSQYGKTGISLVKPGNLDVNGFVNLFNKHATYIPKRFWEENPSYRVFENELLMNLTAQSLEDQFLGRVCITPENTQCLLNQRIARIIPKEIDKQFLYWQLKGKHFREHVDLAPKGTKVKHLYNNDLDTALLPIPKSTEEQERIAEVLWKQDSLIKSSELELFKFKKIKTGLMQDLLTGKVCVDSLVELNINS